jgi:CDP-glucose 4,6-dehydratase
MGKERDFWFGKRVLITGGEGFAASHLIKGLLERGAVVITTIRHTRPYNTLKLLSGDSHMPDVEYCNLLNYQEVRRLCDRHQIDTIYHLAASAIVGDAARSPLSTAENNIIPTLNLLEVARINNIPRVIVASTDKSYGEHATDKLEPLPYREAYALRGLDVYSASKVSTDMLAQMYVFQFKLPVIVTRACNFFGPGDLNFTRLIPRTIMRLLSKKAPVINVGNQKVLREYMYIDDITRAYLILGEKMAKFYGEKGKNIPKNGQVAYGWPAFNIGSYTSLESKNLEKCGSIKSVEEVIKVLMKKIYQTKPEIIKKPANFIEIPDQYLDSSKIRSLGFKNDIAFEKALDQTITWYKKNYSTLLKYASKYIND